MDNYKGFYKVEERGMSYVIGVFYNPTTNEYFETCICDLDYDDGRNDKDDLRFMIRNLDAQKQYFHHLGDIYANDEIIIHKGRKMLGEKKIVKYKKDIKVSSYYEVPYLYFTDGTRCVEHNCKQANELEKPKKVEYNQVQER